MKKYNSLQRHEKINEIRSLEAKLISLGYMPTFRVKLSRQTQVYLDWYLCWLVNAYDAAAVGARQRYDEMPTCWVKAFCQDQPKPTINWSYSPPPSSAVSMPIPFYRCGYSPVPKLDPVWEKLFGKRDEVTL